MNLEYDQEDQRGMMFIGPVATSADKNNNASATFFRYQHNFSTLVDYIFVHNQFNNCPSITHNNYEAPCHIRQIATGGDVTALFNLSYVMLLEGRYNHRLHFALAGASGAPITVGGAPGHKVIIDAPMDTTLTSNIASTGGNGTANFFVTNANLIGAGPKEINIDNEIFRGVRISDTEIDITARPVSGTTQAAHSIGALVRHSGPAVYQSGSFTILRDMRVEFSSGRSRASNANTFNAFQRGGIYEHVGSDNAVFNMDFLNGGIGLVDQSGGANGRTEFCRMLFNGTSQVDGSAGHSGYFQSSDTKMVRGNVFHASFANDINVSSQAPHGPISFIANTWMDTGAGQNSLRTPNSLTAQYNRSWNEGPQWGPDLGSQGTGALDFQNNYITGQCKLMDFTSATIRFNTCAPRILNTGATMTVEATTPTAYVVNNNFLYRGRTGLADRRVFQLNAGPHSWNSTSSGTGPYWTSVAGSGGNFEAGSAYSTSSNDLTASSPNGFFHEHTSSSTGVRPSALRFFLHKATKSQLMGKLDIYNWAGASSVNVNLATDELGATFAVPGDIIEIENNFEPGKLIVPAFVYAGDPVAFPMAVRSAGGPTGYHSLFTTPLEFISLRVIKK
jgi:hypothetical protein